MAKKQDSISGIKGVGINARPRLFKIHEYTRPDIKTSEIKQRGENKASVIENPKHFPVISIERKAAVTCIKKVSQTTIPIQAPFNQKHQLSNLQLPINVPSRVDNFTPSFCQQPLQELEVSIPIPPEQREEREAMKRKAQLERE
ncbi:hypothetical protein FKM82_018713 [Ascaphus truei]